MKKPESIFKQLQAFEKEINRLEERILELEQRMVSMVQVERNHLLRVKNREELSDEFIYYGRKFLDLSPDKAYKLYNDKNFDFILVDVSSKDYDGPRLPGAIRMPWDDFKERFSEIHSQVIPLMIICEDGAHSILACEFLAKHGFFNCNNVSGGYKHWRGFRLIQVPGESA